MLLGLPSRIQLPPLLMYTTSSQALHIDDKSKTHSPLCEELQEALDLTKSWDFFTAFAGIGVVIAIILLLRLRYPCVTISGLKSFLDRLGDIVDTCRKESVNNAETFERDLRR
jgi:hypothetical protein